MSAVETSSNETPDQEQDDATLYVVFHGEIAFFDSGEPDDDILAYASEMDIHEYSAGEWLGENRIPKGLTLKLKGVSPGTVKFADNQEVTATFTGAGPTGHRRHMTIQLPRPDEIFSGGRIQVNPADVTIVGPGSLHVPSDYSIALAVVFRYRVSEAPGVPRLVIVDGAVSPGFSPQWVATEAQEGYFVLHVYAEADCFPGTEHIQMATKEAAALLGINVKVTIHNTQPARQPAAGRPGLTAEEINLTLADRTISAGDLGMQFREGKECLYFHDPNLIHATGFGAGACGTCAGIRR
jgi:hypothetical protein